MIADIKSRVEQVSPSTLKDGDQEAPRLSTIGQLFTADWHQRLILAGRAYRMTIGTISGSAAHTLVGNGTTIDLDLPQGVVAVDSGYLIPMALNLGLLTDTDAENDVCEVLLTTDRAVAVSVSDLAAGETEVPANMLDGGEAFSGRAASILNTTPITDPVHTDLLHYSNWEALGANPLVSTNYNVDKEFVTPTLLKGPCSLLLYFGGTVAVTGMGSLVFAHIPSSWAPTP